ncbi:Flp family type IVb pilin [uncultured Bosea sp.]|uniref:Flp family type IVb pilin n=1 Tax=uncultured Bosea sp. TaxID=211457 RepID=UPI0025E10B28|nr:Flp family type IVb pilin [uncultured Bosea sp.]
MERIKDSFLELVRDERGATAIEYGLVAGLISITIIASATLYGTSVSTMLMAAANRLAGF